MNSFELLIADVFDNMMGTAKHNYYILEGDSTFRTGGKGRNVWVNEKRCYAYFITGTGCRPEGFKAWLEARK